MSEMREQKIERLRTENWQLKGALGYPVPGDIPQGPFKCGLCEAKANDIERLRAERDELFLENGRLVNTIGAENLRLRTPFKHAVASDWDYLHRLLVTAVRSSTDQQTLFWLAVFKEARATYEQHNRATLAKAGGKDAPKQG